MAHSISLISMCFIRNPLVLACYKFDNIKHIEFTLYWNGLNEDTIKLHKYYFVIRCTTTRHHPPLFRFSALRNKYKVVKLRLIASSKSLLVWGGSVWSERDRWFLFMVVKYTIRPIKNVRVDFSFRGSLSARGRFSKWPLLWRQNIKMPKHCQDAYQIGQRLIRKKTFYRGHIFKNAPISMKMVSNCSFRCQES